MNISVQGRPAGGMQIKGWLDPMASLIVWMPAPEARETPGACACVPRVPTRGRDGGEWIAGHSCPTGSAFLLFLWWTHAPADKITKSKRNPCPGRRHFQAAPDVLFNGSSQTVARQILSAALMEGTLHSIGWEGIWDMASFLYFWQVLLCWIYMRFLKMFLVIFTIALLTEMPETRWFIVLLTLTTTQLVRANHFSWELEPTPSLSRQH